MKKTCTVVVTTGKDTGDATWAKSFRDPEIARKEYYTWIVNTLKDEGYGDDVDNMSREDLDDLYAGRNSDQYDDHQIPPKVFIFYEVEQDNRRAR